jgi:hypothetical protein
MNEISFFYAAIPQSGFAREVHIGRKQVKIRLNLVFTINATGCDCLKVLFTGKVKAPQCFPREESCSIKLEVNYNNAKVWMTHDIFSLGFLTGTQTFNLLVAKLSYTTIKLGKYD